MLLFSYCQPEVWVSREYQWVAWQNAASVLRFLLEVLLLCGG